MKETQTGDHRRQIIHASEDDDEEEQRRTQRIRDNSAACSRVASVQRAIVLLPLLLTSWRVHRDDTHPSWKTKSADVNQK